VECVVIDAKPIVKFSNTEIAIQSTPLDIIQLGQLSVWAIAWLFAKHFPPSGLTMVLPIFQIGPITFNAVSTTLGFLQTDQDQASATVLMDLLMEVKHVVIDVKDTVNCTCQPVRVF
jgi:hypothetical protein